MERDERAVILAGGKGTRLAPYTTILPKPLMPIGEIPIVEVIVRQLYRSGFHHITMSVGYLEGLLRAYFADVTERFPGLTVDYSREDEPLGTAGPLALIQSPGSSFLVMNGDVLTTLQYDRFLDYHRECGAALTIACHRKQVRVDLGVIEFDADNRVRGYREKPVMQYPVSMGVYAYDPRALACIERGQYLDFPDLVLRLVAAGEQVAVYPSDAIWLDIGRPEDYHEAVRIFEENAERFVGER